MRRLLKPLWIFLALVFIFEEWLWEALAPVVARLVALVPLHRLKEWIVREIEHFPPPAMLFVFAGPLFVMFLIESAIVWLVADYWFLVAAVLVLAKFAGVGVSAFLFGATKSKLLQMAWFKWGYERVLAALAWAHRLADPYVVRLRALAARLRGDGELLRMVRLIRKRIRRSRMV